MPKSLLIQLCHIPGFLTDDRLGYAFEQVAFDDIKDAIVSRIKILESDGYLLLATKGVNREKVIMELDIDCIKSMLISPEAIVIVLSSIPDEYRVTLVNQLGLEFIRQKFTNIESLKAAYDTYHKLYPDKTVPLWLLELIGKAFIEKVLDYKIMSFHKITTDYRPGEMTELMTLLGQDAMRKFVHNEYTLELSVSMWNIERSFALIGYDHVNNIVTASKDVSLLVTIFSNITTESFDSIASGLRDSINNKVKTGSDLYNVLEVVLPNKKLTLINLLDAQRFNAIIAQWDDMIGLQKMIDSFKGPDFDALLEKVMVPIREWFTVVDPVSGFDPQFAKNYLYLLRNVDVSIRFPLVTGLGRDLFNKIFPSVLEHGTESGMGLADFLEIFPEESRGDIIKLLDFEMQRVCMSRPKTFDEVMSRLNLYQQLELTESFGPTLVVLDRENHFSYMEGFKIAKSSDRAITFFSDHQNAYDSKMTDDLMSSIQTLFEDNHGSSSHTPVLLSIGHAIQREIVQKCRQHPSAEVLRDFLRHKLLQIDELEGSQYSSQPVLSHKGELAMRIMYSVDKLNLSLKPKVEAVNKPQSFM
jgi:hypothetical protein